MRRLLAALALIAAPAFAELNRYTVFELLANESCADLAPRAVLVIDGQDSLDCSVGGGELEVQCDCFDGTWSAMIGQHVSDDRYLIKIGVTGGQFAVGGNEDTDHLTLKGSNSTDAPSVYLQSATASSSRSVILELDSAPTAVRMSMSGTGLGINSGSTFATSWNTSGSEVARVESDGDLATDGCVQLGSSNVAGSSACFCRNASDAIYHDTDCDSTQDGGENELADAGGHLFLAPYDMQGIAGAISINAIGGITPYVGFPDAATTEALGMVSIPPSLVGRTWDIKLFMAPSTTATCNYRMAVEAKALEDGDAINVAGSTTAFTAASSGAASVADYYDPGKSISTDAGDKTIAVAVQRSGADLADTCTNELRLVMVLLEIQ